MVAGAEHNVKKQLKALDHERKIKAKKGRLDRHSGTGRSRNESPKKGGSGSKTVWGSYRDDLVDYEIERYGA